LHDCSWHAFRHRSDKWKRDPFVIDALPEYIFGGLEAWGGRRRAGDGAIRPVRVVAHAPSRIGGRVRRAATARHKSRRGDALFAQQPTALGGKPPREVDRLELLESFLEELNVFPV
jgi:hypothetical protein